MQPTAKSVSAPVKSTAQAPAEWASSQIASAPTARALAVKAFMSCRRFSGG